MHFIDENNNNNNGGQLYVSDLPFWMLKTEKKEMTTDESEDKKDKEKNDSPLSGDVLIDVDCSLIALTDTEANEKP